MVQTIRGYITQIKRNTRYPILYEIKYDNGKSELFNPDELSGINPCYYIKVDYTIDRRRKYKNIIKNIEYLKIIDGKDEIHDVLLNIFRLSKSTVNAICRKYNSDSLNVIANHINKLSYPSKKDYANDVLIIPKSDYNSITKLLSECDDNIVCD
jgi:hypothetical protein